MHRPLSLCLFLATTLSGINTGLVGPQTWDQDCENAHYVPTAPASLEFLAVEYHRKFGPAPNNTRNTVKISEISRPENLKGAVCGSRAADMLDENLASGATDELRLPWVVAVRGSKYYCAAVLLTADFILSPVRCVDPSSKVFLGNKNRRNFTSKTQIRHTVANYFIPAVKLFKKGFDIGLIKMNEPVVFSDIIRPICLPAAQSQFHLHDCFLLNWGRYDPVRKELSDDLLILSAELMDAYECQFRYTLARTKVNASEVCVAFKKPMGAVNKCSVDTGGPVVCKVKGRYYVAALSSYVESGCTNHLLPDIFTKVPMFENWIAQKVLI